MKNESGKTGNSALYRRISEDLYGKIERGELKPGDRLPSEALLAGEQGVSVGTVKKAYDILTPRSFLPAHYGAEAPMCREKRPRSQKERRRKRWSRLWMR